MTSFEIGERDFLLDGRRHRILSGAIHYFRVHPAHWRDRIRKARLMGLNTIETYVAWSLHEPERGAWRADGALDLAGFLDAVAAEGMHAIVRPGPYICAELDNGGLPTWLLADPEVRVRTREPRYLAAVGGYLDRVTALVAPRQIDRGGPVVLMQVENEYGAYGDDREYLRIIAERMRAGGITVPFTTVDQPQPEMLRDGSVEGALVTGSFGSRSPERLATLREHQPTGPLMCSEYWDGWFDRWGDAHRTTPADASAADLDALLSLGASVNLYMFHGGTNFGLTSGANDRGVFEPTVTSYDYDAPLDEAGRPTAKFFAYRDVIARHAGAASDAAADAVLAPRAPAPTASGRLELAVPLLDVVADALAGVGAPSSAVVEADELPTFDAIRGDAALLIGTAQLSRPAGLLVVGEVRDRVHVVVDGALVGVLSREYGERALALPAVRDHLTLVVENQGRVNYGPRLGEAKGVVGGIAIDGEPVRAWRAVAVREGDLRELAELAADRGDAIEIPPGAGIPALHLALGELPLGAEHDRFLDTTPWGKGIAWIDGFCLGRYWSRPPQRTLFVPGPALHPDRSRLVVLALDAAPSSEIRFAADADLGPVID
jgi:beta-galactosidase